MANDQTFGHKIGEKVTVKGTVDSLRVINPQAGWGYGQLYVWNKMKSGGRFGASWPIVGILGDLYIGAEVEVTGAWADHNRFGAQFKVDLAVVQEPSTADSVKAWLEYRMDDVGPVRASRLVAAFPGDQLWKIIQDEPHRLEEVEGVGPAVAQSIVEAYEVFKFELEQFTQLAVYGLRAQQIREAIARWGPDASRLVADNPYVLMELRGIAFKSADVVGRRVGLARDDKRRIAAGLSEAARLAENQGHTRQSLKKLASVAASSDVLGISPNVVLQRADPAAAQLVALSTAAGYGRLRTHKQEQAIADGVRRLLEDPAACESEAF